MSTPSRAKGDRAERETRALIYDLLGIDAPRIRAGASDDIGDLALPLVTVEVKSHADLRTAIAEGLTDLEAEHARTDNPFAALFCKWPRSRRHPFIVVQTPEMWATYHREATG